jgi:hypothetical protein
MKPLSCLVALIVSVAFTMVCRSQEPKEKNADKEPKPPEFKVLAKLIGTWGVPTAKNPKAIRAKWAVGGTYVQIEHSSDVENMTLITWDKEKKVFRLWRFSSMGSVLEGKGKWDNKSNTLTFTSEPNAEGATNVLTYTVDDENLVFQVDYNVKAGKRSGGSFKGEYKKYKE